MSTIRWHTLFAALIVWLGASSLRAQNPLEQLEAKLLEQEKIEALPKGEFKKETPKKLSEKLPGPSQASKSLLVEPIVAADPPYLGMTLERAPGGGLGLRVVEVVHQSPAWKSGFQIDDRVLAVGGNAVSDIESFANEITKSTPNQAVPFVVDRRGRQMEMPVVLIPRSLAEKSLPEAAQAGNPFPPADQAPSTTNLSPNLPNHRSSPRVPQSIDGSMSLGLVLAPLSDAFRKQFGIPVFRGASVLDVAANSPGFLSGLVAGDCIVDIDGCAIQSEDDVVRWKRSASPGSSVSVRFYRYAQLMQTMLSIPNRESTADPNYRPAVGSPDISPDMLTPDYIQQLRAEVERLRTELAQSQNRIQSLERQIERR